MKRLSQFLVLALIVGAGVGIAFASAKTVNGCEIVGSPNRDHHTNCPGAYLPGANLRLEHLSFANLRSAVLTGANLSFAILSGANLQRAHLFGAYLMHADLSGANVSGANLRGTILCRTIMPDGSRNDSDCGSPGAKPPLSKSRTFMLAAATTRTFDVGYPSALKYKRAKYFCDARASGRGKRYVKILSHRSARGGSVCRVKARNNAKLPSLDTTAKITVTATTIR